MGETMRAVIRLCEIDAAKQRSSRQQPESTSLLRSGIVLSANPLVILPGVLGMTSPAIPR
jgi:hypothetical protein